MTPHLILIPIRWYPEFFHFCVRGLKECREIEDYTMRFLIGRPFDPNILPIITASGLRHEVVFCESGSLERDIGEGMKQASVDSPGYFLMVAGDERVSRDHLEVCRAVYSYFQTADLLSYSARGIKRLPQDVEKLARSHSFHTQGLMVFTKPFAEYCAPYLNAEYYRSEAHNPFTGSVAWFLDYFLKYFPEWDFTLAPKGIDGLLDTVCRQHNLFTLTAVVPRVQEICPCGVNKLENNRVWEKAIWGKAIDERIKLVERLISDSYELGRKFGQYAHDFYELWQADHEWRSLEVVALDYEPDFVQIAKRVK